MITTQGLTGSGGTGLTLSTLVNNAGTVTIMGSFTTTISGGIGSLVTGITVNSGSGNATVGAVTVGSSQSWANKSANKLTVNGAVTGGTRTLTLSGDGAGLTTLTGGLSFTDAGGLIISKTGTAGVTITGGTITLGGTGGITIDSGASVVSLGAATISAAQPWANNSSTTMTTAGILAINSQLTLTAGTIKFGNFANTGTGGVKIDGATAQAGNAAAFGASGGTLTLTSGTVSSDGGLARSFANAVALNGTVTFGASSGGTGSLTFNGGMTVNGSYAINNLKNVTFSTLSTAVGANTLTLGGSGGTLNFTGGMTISGAGGLVISHTGGTTTISGGTIDLGGTGGITIDSGASAVSLGAATISADQTWANNSSTKMTATSGALTINNQLTLSGGAFTIGNAGSTGAGGVLIDGIAVTAFKGQAFGTGTLTLASGSSLIHDNSDSNAIDFGNDLVINGSVTINAGSGGLTFSGATQAISGSPTITLIANNPINFGGVALEDSSITTFYQTGTSGLTQSAPWTGAGAALVFDMEGTATLDQANTFDGGVTVDRGVVDVNNDTGLGPVGANLSIGTASTSAGVVFNANASIGNLTIADNSNSDPTIENRIIINDGYSLSVNPTVDSVANGPVNTSTTGALIKEGTYTLTLNDPNFDYAGLAATVNGGKLVSQRAILNPIVNSGGELDTTYVYGNVIVNGTGKLDLSGSYEIPMYSLNGDGSITNGGSGSSIYVGEGDWSGTISGGGALSVTGYQNGHGASGTLIVRTAQAYTGSTYVDTGYTLKLVGAANLVASSSVIQILAGGFLDVTETTAFTLAAGQTLMSDGLVNGNLTVGSGSFLNPAYHDQGFNGRPGTLNQTGNQTWAGGGTYVWDINDATGTEGTDPGWDLVNITGDLTISATSGNKFIIDLTTLDLGNHSEAMANFDVSQNYTWKIATCTGTLTCDDTAFAFDTTHYIGAPIGTLSVTYDAQNVYLNHSAAAALVPASWTNSATSGNWSAPGNWDPALVPNAYGAEANFTNAFVGDPTITVDVTNTIGTLNVGGALNAARLITFTNNSDNAALVFKGTSAQLTKAAGTQRTVVAVPLDVQNNLTINNNSDAGDLYINAPITQNGKTIVNAGTGTGALRMGYSAGGSRPDIVQDSLTSPLVLGADTVGEVHLLSGTVRASDSTAFDSWRGMYIGNKDESYSATGKTLMLVSDSDLAFVHGGIAALNCEWTITLGRSSSAGPGTKATMLCGLGFVGDDGASTLTVNRLNSTVYTGESANYAVNSGTAELIFGGVWFARSQGKHFNIAAGTRLTLGHIDGDTSGNGFPGLHTTLTKQGAGTLGLSDGMALRDADGNDPNNRKGCVVEEGTLMVNRVSHDFVPNYLTVNSGAIFGGNSTLDLSTTTLTYDGAILNVPVRLDGTSDALTVTGGDVDLGKLTLQIEDTGMLNSTKTNTVLTSTHTGTFAGHNLPSNWHVDYSDGTKVTVVALPSVGTRFSIR